ncbi:MAG: MFS transporter [Chloroflexi bacterium]|nr:MFS transporter [Chloroflexota bacterium]MCI0644527.1 MFS transporter [Chloroflexota bacterium]MCI0728784.1 MFS transporter [Chloroflexota bacterium]
MRRPPPSLILAVVAFGVFVAADDLTVVSTMLRQIIFDLEIPLPDGLDDAAWIVNAYLIAYVVVMPFVGRLSDILGRRAVYVGALFLFLAGSIWVPFAPNLPTFIVGRVLTALGGGAMVPVGMAILGDIYEPRRRASALGALGAVDTAGWVWGPLYGALLIRYLTWRWQFYLNIPLSLVGIAAAWWALGGLPRPARRERIDWLGTAALTAALLALNVALLNSSDIQSVGSLADLSGQQSPNTLPLYILSAVCLVLFIAIERTLTRHHTGPGFALDTTPPHPHTPTSPPPLIDFRLFTRRNFTPAVLVNFLIGSTLIIAVVNVPLLINVIEFDVEQAAVTSGWLLSAMTASMAVAAYAGGRLTERWGYRPVALAGLLACAVGFSLMGSSWTAATPYQQMAWHLAILGLGFGLVIAPIGAAVINAAPEDQRGIASGLVIVLRLIGMSVGLSGLTAWGLHRFNVLRTLIELPPLDDPGFQTALIEGLTNTTVAVLAETFLVSAGLALLALLVALALRRDTFTADH